MGNWWLSDNQHSRNNFNTQLEGKAKAIRNNPILYIRFHARSDVDANDNVSQILYSYTFSQAIHSIVKWLLQTKTKKHIEISKPLVIKSENTRENGPHLNIHSPWVMSLIITDDYRLVFACIYCLYIAHVIKLMSLSLCEYIRNRDSPYAYG